MNNLANSGGAYYLYDSISSITNSKFINNNATGSEFNYGGAGIYLDSSESSLVDNCTFINNTAINGGAMHCHLSFPTINNSFFDNNKAENGGACYIYRSMTSINNSKFVNNSVNSDSEFVAGGAITNTNSYGLNITNSIFL